MTPPQEPSKITTEECIKFCDVCEEAGTKTDPHPFNDASLMMIRTIRTQLIAVAGLTKALEKISWSKENTDNLEEDEGEETIDALIAIKALADYRAAGGEV